MWKPQVRYLTCADPENFLEGVRHLQTRVDPAFTVESSYIYQRVDHGTDSFFWYIQRPEQDFTILINLSPQILGLLRLYFPLSREKIMVGPGTVSIRLDRLL